MPPSHGGLHQRVAFRIHPVQTAEEESVEQPWEFAHGRWPKVIACMGLFGVK
jgi:hypothetical protein